MRSFRKLQRLSVDERWLLAQALVFLPLTVLGIHALGVTRWQRALTKLTLFRKNPDPNSDDAESQSTGHSFAPGDGQVTSQRARVIARIVRIAARHGIYRANCLQQSLVLWWLLRRDRIDSDIRFGARKEELQLKAHAWVECFGIVLNEDGDVHQRFSPFEGVT